MKCKAHTKQGNECRLGVIAAAIFGITSPVISKIISAHHTLRTGYSRLVDHLNRFPQCAPPSLLLIKILKMLFSENKAEWVANVPMKSFTAERVSNIWKMDGASAQKVLDALANRSILVVIDHNGISEYTLSPPMVGFLEFSLMRVRSDINQKVLNKLFYHYLKIEEDSLRELISQGETQLGITFVHEPALSRQNALQVLGYERASEEINTGSHLAIGSAPAATRCTISTALAARRWASAGHSATAPLLSSSMASPGSSTKKKAWICCNFGE